MHEQGNSRCVRRRCLQRRRRHPHQALPRHGGARPELHGDVLRARVHAGASTSNFPRTNTPNVEPPFGRTHHFPGFHPVLLGRLRPPLPGGGNGRPGGGHRSTSPHPKCESGHA